jgi:hypothetical protein
MKMTARPPQCPNAQYRWHQIDGYCKECVKQVRESDAVIKARRNAKGYR